MKTKIMRIATMAVMMLAAMSMAEAQEAANGRGGTRYTSGPCLPAIHAMEDHQGAWCYIDQVTDLVAGWNWWSTHIMVTLDELKAALVDALPGTPITIKSKTSSTTYNGIRWRGNLTTLDVTQMYKILVMIPCEITLTGMPLNAAKHPITIKSGPNWIGFPFNVDMSLADAFAGFAINGDVVKSKASNATYNGTRWRGVLTTLEPGQGYIYNSNATGDRTFTFPASAK